MLLTAPLLSKTTFFGSLFNKCRQVIKPQKTLPTTSTNNTIKNQKTNNNFTLTTDAHMASSSVKSLSTTIDASEINTNKIPNTNRPVFVNASNTISTTSSNLKTIEEQVGLPPRPKKPITPYFRYMLEMRPKVLSEDPKLGTKDIVRLLSKKWATVEPNVRQRFQDEYKREQLKYIELRTKYDAKVTDEQRAEIKSLKQAKSESKEKRKMRQRIKELGRPRRPPSAFLRFIQTERISTPQLPKQTYKVWLEKCVAKWARLSDVEKENYIKEARADFEKYKKSMTEWEERMMRTGNVDVVRSSNLIDPPEPKPKKH